MWSAARNLVQLGREFSGSSGNRCGLKRRGSPGPGDCYRSGSRTALELTRTRIGASCKVDPVLQFRFSPNSRLKSTPFHHASRVRIVSSGV